MVVVHNLYAMNAQRQYNLTGLNKKKSTEKLSSGFKINRAADDAAGLSISEKMRKQISGLDRGTDNMQDGVSWVQIGDGAMAEVHAILQRMTELSVQGANGTLSPQDREAIDREIQQLKVEINRINETTKFNDKRIFSKDDRELDDNGELIINKLDGNPVDLKIFDATYDDVTGDVTYGGIVFDGNRISWDAIDPNMVYMDGGTQKFHEGTWVYVDAASDRKLTFSAKEGDEVPSITRNFNVSANMDGLLIDGDLIKWEDIKSKSGDSMADGYLNEKTWVADYHGAKLIFTVNNAFNGISGLVDAIKEESANNRFRLYAVYAGSSEVQAVDADINNSRFEIRSTAVAQNVVSGNGYTLRAGDGTSGHDGLWLEDANGNEVTGSFQSWADLGINSWDSGSDIKAALHNYKYTDKDGVNDTHIEFPFTLSDITSKDSVIDGLDGVKIDFGNANTKYNANLNFDNTGHTNVLSAEIVNQNINVTLQNELDLGRDFDVQAQDVGSGNWGIVGGPAYYPNQWSATPSGSSTGVVDYAVSWLNGGSNFSNLADYGSYVIADKITETLAGIPSGYDLGQKDLADLLGVSKVTTSGKMTETVTITGSMEISDGPAGGYTDYTDGLYKTADLEVGKTYLCASIDFSGLGTDYAIWDLINSGFDSTCGSCPRHYSFKFVADTAGNAQTADGYRYNTTIIGSRSTGTYVLELSVKSLVEKGVRTGEDLAKALVKISADNQTKFDNHYQQYAQDGAKLYICDGRPTDYWEDYPKRHGKGDSTTFETKPNEDIKTEDNYVVQLRSTSNGWMNLQYAYRYVDYRDWIKVDMVNDSAGQYVQRASGGYEEYDPAKHAGMQRYNVQVSYSNSANGPANNSGAGTTTLTVGGKSVTVSMMGSKSASVTSYCFQALRDMANSTGLQLHTYDYTTAAMRGDENPNVAINSLFDAYSAMATGPSHHESIKYEDSIMILKSGEASNKLFIPRFSLNTACLGLTRANCITQSACRNTIDMVSRALRLVSDRRSLYGALQNRMEHAIRSNENTEENTTAAESRIRDTDMAEEMVNFTKNNILAQAGEAMLAQANQMNQGVLALLQ